LGIFFDIKRENIDICDNMLESIEIKNFKRIGAEGLKLNNLKKVNYLVGENGSGKSSVLELMHLNDLICKDLFNNTKTLTDKTYIEKCFELLSNEFKKYDSEGIYYNKKSPSLSYNNKIQNLLHLEDNKKINSLLVFSGNHNPLKILASEKFDEELNEKYFSTINKKSKVIKGYAKVFRGKETIEKYKLNHFDSEFKVIDFGLENRFGFESNVFENLAFKKFIKKYKLGIKWFKGKNRLFYKEPLFKDGYNMVKPLNNHLASGDIALFNLIKIYFKYFSGGNTTTLLFEEPESFLHPSYQKILPSLLNDLFINESSSVQIFITTHSPFIISAAGEYSDTQKVYMIEDGVCLNPEGSSGKDVKGIAATMLGAGIEDLTPSTVVFCAQSEKTFLEKINTKWYFKDILFRTPSNGGDSHINNMAYIEDIFKFGGDFFPNAEILYYRDCFDITQKTDKDMKQKYDNNEKFKKKIILSDYSSFEAKFGEDPKVVEKQIGSKIQNAKNQAEKFINKGETGKTEFQKLFPELGDLLGFTGKK
jgi:AAA15 family ATPase/GTPase